MRLISTANFRDEMTWERAITALFHGHRGVQPRVQDILLEDGPFSLFGRGVILPGYGAGMKIASIYPPNSSRTVPTPMEHSVFAVVDENSKQIVAIFDGPELTRWKTAADSALGSRLLSREDSETLLVIGAGPIASALIDAHLYVRPNLKRVLLWNRTKARLKSIGQRLQNLGYNVEIITDLNVGVAQADIISSATASCDPLILSEFVQPGSHVDLVGGFTPDMREADNNLILNSKVFVNCWSTTIEHAGDICQPIAQGVLSVADIRGDLFDLVKSPITRSQQDITLYKNAGGAHIDLIVASALL
jgi:ornithine cyclodeaminase/alanine dehydrogenase-like protein (mu-crystallin family)